MICGGATMSLIRISESENCTIDYDVECGMYRVGILENGHCKESCWFDAYEKKEVKDLYALKHNVVEV